MRSSVCRAFVHMSCVCVYVCRGVADKLGHQVNSDSYAHISSIASCTQNLCLFVISCFAHDFSSMEEGCSNANDLLQTNILFTILIRLEKPSSASSDNSIIPCLLLSEVRLVSVCDNDVISIIVTTLLCTTYWHAW